MPDRRSTPGRGLRTALLLMAVTTPIFAASRPAVRGSGGAVASDEKLATEIGIEILRTGGNAVDAAVATVLALAVVAPEAGNLGGGGFAIVKFGEKVAFLDFRETAPAAARRNLFLDEKGEPVPEASLVGPLAAGVPGSPMGFYELHHRWGRLPWKQIVEPARRLATEGFLVSRRLHTSLGEEIALLRRFPETTAVWLDDGAPWPAGKRLRLPALAATLASYATEGPTAITRGPVAAAIEAASARHGGILTAADLAAYRPVWREPLRFEALGWQVATADLPSAGGIVLAAASQLLEKVAWGAEPRFGAGRAHLWAEVLRRVYADRFLLGDPATTEARAADLLDPRWLDSRASSIDRMRATPSSQIAPWSAAGAGEKPATTHVSAIDAEGNLVALTTTLNGLFGCGLLVPEAGFLLNNEMDDFATAPGRPNDLKLVQGEANAVGAGKRMLSSQTPTIAWRGEEAIALGGRGGSRIPTAVLGILLAVWVDGDGLQAAIDRPRLHHQWLPDQILVEADALTPETRAELERRGHPIEVGKKTLAQAHAVRRLAGGEVEAAADPRSGGGWAAVVEPRF